MIDVFTQPVLASIKVFQKKGYFISFLLLIPAISLLLYLIPVKAIPSNSFAFQATLFQIQDWMMITLIAVLESLLLIMNAFLLFRRERKHNIDIIGQGNVGLFSGIPAFLFGTKLCPMCLFGIFGFLGGGAVLFFIQYQRLLFIFSIILLLFSLYSVSKRINIICIKCR